MSHEFKIVSPFHPTGDQPKAIESLVTGINDGEALQVLLGATGTGKTFTIANVIERVQKTTLVLVHNKTLAGQLYEEFKELFPHNRVEYFVSNFDFYQPEAYLPKSDTYIEKTALMNEEIEMMRTSAINSILERRDTIVVASVASIYGLTDPDEYRNLVFYLRTGEKLDRHLLLSNLINAQYAKNSYDYQPGTFRTNGDIIDIVPPHTKDYLYRIDTFDDVIESIAKIEIVSGSKVESYKSLPIFPAYEHASTALRIKEATTPILKEMIARVEYFLQNNKPLEAERIENRTKQDVDSMLEFGMTAGIENYSRYIDQRAEGSRPFCLLDYFKDDYLLVIDESHVTIPQLHGMYGGDRSRKLNLVEYGFRLPSALDNRPLSFAEFEQIMPQTICTSATPGDYELKRAGNKWVEQIIRPTGLLDPKITVVPTNGQIDHLIAQINKRIEKNERVIIVALTIKMAEDLTTYLKNMKYKVTYLHNEVKTLERLETLYEFRKGKYDILVGINLIREGIDLPEVSLIAILDADKEGFLRSSRSLIQIIGRTARNVNGEVMMYADNLTDSMKTAINETNRRRGIQEEYNKLNHIIPQTVFKEIRPPISIKDKGETTIKKIIDGKLSRNEINKYLRDFEKEMREAAKQLNFERAAELRDIILELRAMNK
ncbi:MAG: excinuclease ABC subunit UvrB [Erysipelotrichaceae bacterium]|jgi:excinuclease ABC subunit B|nr:excinuclease ABC subunit UvrB [Erysipelotrichaceae bacterium]